MEREKCWWTVVTDCGTRRTLAVSRAKAIRNVKYRLVMDDRRYARPRPRDFAEMREIEILEITPDGAGESGLSTPDGAPRIEPPSALATLGGYGESGRQNPTKG